MSRERNARMANETVEIVKNGFYINSNKSKVMIDNEMKHALEGTILYPPNAEFDDEPNHPIYETEIQVVNRSTLSAAKDLLEEGFNRVVCLNFASAKNPGGGFLKGSNAQEESLARSSGLYECLQSQRQMYSHNKQIGTCMYSDYIIYSNQVPVFRDDFGNLLDYFYLASFITSPAVNKGVVMERESQENKRKIHEVMQNRINKILKIGIKHEQEAIVLGAFGCGVFKNDPKDVANYFIKALLAPEIKGKYKKVIFAIYRDEYALKVFTDVLKI